MPTADIQDKTIVATSGGTPPDIAGLEAVDVAAFADNGAIVKLDDYCKKYGIKGEDYIPVYWNMSVYKDHIYSGSNHPSDHRAALQCRRFQSRRIGSR